LGVHLPASGHEGILRQTQRVQQRSRAAFWVAAPLSGVPIAPAGSFPMDGGQGKCLTTASLLATISVQGAWCRGQHPAKLYGHFSVTGA
jgi:hypothetical protein